MAKKLLLIALIILSNQALADATSSAASSVTAASATKTPNTSTAGTATSPSASAATTTPKRADASPYIGAGISMQNVRGYTGLMPKIFLGYGSLMGICKKRYFGVEVFAATPSLPLSQNQRSRVANFFGVSAIPGYMWYPNILLFARFGIESARYNNLNMTRVGGLVGVGFQYYLDPHWDMRVEYAFNFNRNLNQYNVDFVYKFC